MGKGKRGSEIVRTGGGKGGGEVTESWDPFGSLASGGGEGRVGQTRLVSGCRAWWVGVRSWGGGGGGAGQVGGDLGEGKWAWDSEMVESGGE